MVEKPIAIKRIRLEALPEYAQSFIGPMSSPGVAPITRIRALSQAKNPYARPDDVALLAAYCGGNVVGYHGVLPGLLAIDGRISRVHWSSAVFVTEEFRGRGVGRRLVAAFRSLGKDVVVPGGMTPSAEGAYLSGGFQSLGKRTYYQLRVERIDRTAHLFKRLKTFPPLAGGPVVSAVNWWSSRAYTRQKKRLYHQATAGILPPSREGAWRRVDQIDRFDLTPPKGRTIFFRGTDAVNWMLANPWVYSRDKISQNDFKGEVRHYYFTKTRKLFRYAAFTCDSPGKKTGNAFVVLSMSRTRRRAQVKILDCAVEDGDTARMACILALTAARDILADRIEIPRELVSHFQNHPLLRPLLKHQSPVCVGYPGKKDSPLKKATGKIELNLFDGDAGFTY